MSVSNVLEVMNANIARARRMLALFLAAEAEDACDCGCRHALDQAVISDLSGLDDRAVQPVHALIQRLLQP